MNLCAAQIKPATGEIERNIERHVSFIESAATEAADLIIFPELSLTGYEPELADSLAMPTDDPRLEVFATLSVRHRLVIGLGLPVRSAGGIQIGLLLFFPDQSRRLYAKKYLHDDEKPYFIPGPNLAAFEIADQRVALAICYEISVPEHLEAALPSLPTIYCASVAKFDSAIGPSSERLSHIARTHHVFTVMANAVGPADGGQCAGASAAWGPTGALLGQFGHSDQGLLILDTSTHVTQSKAL